MPPASSIADHCYFVTNGTSTSNKIVWHHAVAPGDVVVVDRNCHKSILHSIIMTGAIPVFLQGPRATTSASSAPIPQSEFSVESIQAKIAANPLLKGVDAKTVKPRVLTLTQSTYDGVLYNTETIKSMLDGYVANLHFDEAWLPHAAFHPFYGSYHGMGKKRARPKHSVVYATQSIHKLLAGISQASHVLVQDSQTEKLDHHLFNEAYLMHTSTSPAVQHHRQLRRGRRDDGAARRHGPGGRSPFWRRWTSAAPCARWKTSSATTTGGSRSGVPRSWPMKAWARPRTGSSAARTRRPSAPRPRNGKEFDNWHGFGELADGFNMLDPIKSTIVTPGLDLDGDFSDTGIPASIVTKYLAEHGVVVEKTGLYSFFIMFTIGITKGRWNTMLTALQQFKDDYDRNQPLARILPEFCQQHRRYERMGLRDLCQHVHQLYAKYDIARLTTEMYLSDLQPAMKPTDAYAHIAQRKTERVEIDHLEGRITVGLVTPYPPGIPLADSRRSVQPQDRGLPAVCARVRQGVPGLRDRHPRPGGTAKRRWRSALLRRLRGRDRAGAQDAGRWQACCEEGREDCGQDSRQGSRETGSQAGRQGCRGQGACQAPRSAQGAAGRA